MAFRPRRRGRGVGRKRPLRWTAESDLITPDPLTVLSPLDGQAVLILDSGSVAPTGADPLESDGCTLTRIRGQCILNMQLINQLTTATPLLRFGLMLVVGDRNGTVLADDIDDEEVLAIADVLWTGEWQFNCFENILAEGVSTFMEALPRVEIDVKAQRKLHSINSCVWLLIRVSASGLIDQGVGDEVSLLTSVRYQFRTLLRM